ncbi:hypothetical protein DFR67_103153 [Williamsia limnetica]|uniref:Uncharacterized protein n=1 Tax=Williamsia limnetica TaxID=882452 RepID=A0A318RLP4_WILLI|nr:hypothetical protein [Williamsia limnetica]PYE19242.1 hypothetical protein DFR67_103153 [Williamsia limnetica]
MKAVVMECRIRVCATPARFLSFRRRAEQLADAAFSGRTRRSSAAVDSGSRLLLRQWHMHNDVTRLGEPQCREVCLAFADNPARLTPAKLEALSRNILATLEIDTAGSSTETVPWILTLTTDADAAYRRQMTDRHPTLHTSAGSASDGLVAPMVSAAQDVLQ